MRFKLFVPPESNQGRPCLSSV